MANSAAAHPPPEPATTSDHPSLTRRVTHQMHATVQQRTTLQRRQTAGLAVAGKHVSELEYETWDSGTPFWQHCLAGSLAGVVEHLLMYPVDTLKTHLQTSGGSSLRQVWQATASWISLWRGAQAMAVGCIPAHAAQFSTYEIIKTGFVRLEHGDNHNHSATTTLGPVGSTVAGAAAALSHDVIMVPADTLKQRLQLGYYGGGFFHALRSIWQTEGPVALWRALPVTLCTNVPYGAVMVTTNETLRRWLLAAQRKHNHDDSEELTVSITLAAGSGAGMMAAAVTAPLDRLKTQLQTQGLRTVTSGTGNAAVSIAEVKYKGFGEAWQGIVRTEGYRGLLRGALPRVVTHTPSVAISWTVYEYIKGWLADHTA